MNDSARWCFLLATSWRCRQSQGTILAKPTSISRDDLAGALAIQHIQSLCVFIGQREQFMREIMIYEVPRAMSKAMASISESIQFIHEI